MRTRAAANPLALWYGILIGPIAMALCEGLSYMLDQHACSTGHYYVFHIVNVLTLLFALSGASVAWFEARKLGPGNEEGGTEHDRSWFMAYLGISSGLAFALVIIALSIPHFILTPCD